MEGRLHVHLRELKTALVDRHPEHGEITRVVRETLTAHLERRIMILSDEVLEVIDKGDFNKAVELLLPGLQKLREERLNTSQEAGKTRRKRKEAKGKKKAGVKTQQERQVESLYTKMMENFK